MNKIVFSLKIVFAMAVLGFALYGIPLLTYSVISGTTPADYTEQAVGEQLEPVWLGLNPFELIGIVMSLVLAFLIFYVSKKKDVYRKVNAWLQWYIELGQGGGANGSRKI